MNGKDLKSKCLAKSATSRRLASLLGCTPQALNSIFSATDVRSGTIEKFKREGRLPEDFEIAEIAYWPNIEGQIHKALGFALRPKTKNNESEGQEYDVYVWYYSFGVMRCQMHDWANDYGERQTAVVWKEGQQRPEFIHALSPWKGVDLDIED